MRRGWTPAPIWEGGGGTRGPAERQSGSGMGGDVPSHLYNARGTRAIPQKANRWKNVLACRQARGGRPAGSSPALEFSTFHW